MKLFGRCVLRALLGLVVGSVFGMRLALAACSPGDSLSSSLNFSPPIPHAGGNFSATVVSTVCQPSGNTPTNPLTFTLSPGSVLPSGASVGANGSVAGFVTAVGSFSFGFDVSDGLGSIGVTNTAAGLVVFGTQTIQFITGAPAATVGGPTYTPNALGGASSFPVTFSIDATSTAGACTFNGAVVRFTGAGSCIIDADQPGDGNYAAAPTARQTVTVSKGSQTVSFTSPAPAATVGGASYAPSASGGGSGNPVTFSIDGTSTAGACTINAGVVSFAGAGSCIIDADQLGNTNYNAASQVQQTVAVGNASQTVSFTSPAPAAKVGGPTYSPSASGGGSGNPVTFSIDGTSTAGACTINAGVVSFAGAGSCIIDANQLGNANYSAAPTATQTVTVSSKGAVTLALASSQNPSSFGQAVTFTVTITAGGTPTGTVTFKDGATTLGAGTLAGGKATFTTSSLALGVRMITASYGGDTNFAAGTSPALSQAVNAPADSIKLRQMQILATQTSAQISGQAISGATGDAIDAGFSDNVQPVTPNGSGFTYNFAADAPIDPRDAFARDGVKDFVATPDRTTNRLMDEEFAALGSKAPPKSPVVQRDWLGWIDVRGLSLNNNNTLGNDLKGNQLNVTAGLTRKLTPDFLVGGFAGYEHLDFNSDALNSRLKGDGWTAGGYLGWRVAQSLRFDMTLARSGIAYNDAAGMAAASFPGDRWLASGGLTGTYATLGKGVCAVGT
jgi:hypothetical protein